MREEKATEELIQKKGLTAPRLSPEKIDEVIRGISYTILPSRKCMVCELTLKNGYTVRGEAACVSPENFDVEVGEKVSFADARGKVWQLEGYLLQEKHPVKRAPAGLSTAAALEALRLGYAVTRPGWGALLEMREEDRDARDWEIVDGPVDEEKDEPKKEEANDRPSK